MPLRDLGTRTLEIGNLPASYLPFDIQGGRTWLIYADIAIEIPNNIYSSISISARFNGGNTKGAMFPDTFILNPRQGTSTFVVNVPSAVSQNTDLILEAIRVPNIFGTSDTAGLITMRLYFETSQVTRT